MSNSSASLMARTQLANFLTVSIVVIISLVGCSASPQLKRGRSLETKQELEPQVDGELVGPPSLLALSEGAIDAEIEEDGKSQGAPRIKMLKKLGRPITVIELWMKAGVAQERAHERGVSQVFEALFKDRLERGGGGETLQAVGAQTRTRLSLDRLIVHIEVENRHCLRALASLSAILKEVREGVKLAETLKKTQSEFSSKSWMAQRLSSRLMIESLNALPENKEEVILSPFFNAEELQSLSVDRVMPFIYAMTEPSQMDLFIVGDFDSSQIPGAASTLFTLSDQERLNAKVSREERTLKKDVKSDLKSQENAQGELAVDIEQVDSKFSSIEIAIPLSELSPEEAGYLDLLGFILVGDQSGLIQHEAERTGLELKGSSVRVVITDRGSVFLVRLELSSNQVNEGWRFLLEQLGGLIHQPIPQRTLERAKSIFERETLLVGESLSGQARRLGYFSTHWPKSEALKRYGRAVYRARPITLLKFIRSHFQSPQPKALIAGPLPTDSEPTMWRERLSEQLYEAMIQRQDTPLLGFSRHGEQLSLLLVPSESDGVSSMVVTIPLKNMSDVARYHRSSHMALAHWFASLVSSKIPNEPHIEAHFDDQSLILYSTFPSRQIGEVFTTLMRRLRQAPLRSESQWQANALEGARLRAMTQLALFERAPQEKLKYLTRRAMSAFTKVSYPLPKERRESLARLSSSELLRWYRQHIQTKPMFAVITGDVEEVQLSRSLSPLNANQLNTLTDLKLHQAPVEQPSIVAISRCRSIKMIADNDDAWLSLSYPIPASLKAVDLKLLESAITLSSKQLNHELRMEVMRPHHTSPHRLTIYLNGAAKSFNEGWKTFRGIITDLKNQAVEDDRLDKIKNHAMRRRLQDLSRTRTYAELHSEAWFRGWQTEKGVGEEDWQKSLKTYTANSLHKVADAVFSEQQLLLSMILPPYVELSPSVNCQVISP